MVVPGQQRAAPGHRRVAPAPALAPAPERVPLRRLMRAAAVACGVQFGWALQLSLLTPYVQELGIAHAWASLVWLCGPLSGLLVQPLAGHMSDRCRSGFGRRRPFIAAGAATIALAVILIGYSADIGDILGDPRGPVHRPRAVVVFVIGFWLLDVGNNATQGPCRALLADLSGKDHRRTRIANAYFSLFMALGNILGFATGSYSGWYTILPFTLTSACSVNCANLKSAFILDIVLLALTTYISISSIQEIPLSDMGAEHSVEEVQQEAFLWELIGSFRYLTPPIWIVLIVVSLTWVGWFPFFLFDTDWMGREIYKGKPNEGHAYHSGVRMGSLGLMLNSVVLGVTSVILERLCRKWGAGLVWGISGILMSICFGAMLIISYVAETTEYPSSGIPPIGIIVAALIVFAVLGAPLAITYSIPYAMISTRTEPLRLGQGLAMGILNLAIVVPQVIVSLGSGPWDQLFGGGNSPAFAVAAVAAFCSGLMAIIALPRSSITRARTHK
ncbi:sucrose transport protein SUT2 [Dioscorea cayenensis subsp. rotundata]|uniref:Sucrose transport protein SUT2 n=1 Tax=Dioscorea cayennensis subsp. rotundata TaxID=55577 RepID=A0AB40CBT7_DIOCR|nr:sucrose transport protein SUT2 [Dioscorea cayenensis subsp. rotundata]XP_039137043.1 sucrose transport protein SUT2 [Dioscorea cayenensis subsp. rotundata]